MSDPTNPTNDETVNGVEKQIETPKLTDLKPKKVLSQKQLETIAKMRAAQAEKLRLKREAKEKETAEKALQLVDKKIDEKLAKRKAEEETEIVYVKRRPKKKVVYIDEDEEEEADYEEPVTRKRSQTIQQQKTGNNSQPYMPATKITFW